MSILEEEDIKKVISSTVKELHEAQAVRFTKPTSLQGWLYVIGAFSGMMALIWTGVVFLNNISEHRKQPYHKGAETLVDAIEKRISVHQDDSELHKRDAELQLKILEETKPIKENISKIQQDVGTIKTKLDILIDRQN